MNHNDVPLQGIVNGQFVTEKDYQIRFFRNEDLLAILSTYWAMKGAGAQEIYKRIQVLGQLEDRPFEISDLLEIGIPASEIPVHPRYFGVFSTVLVEDGIPLFIEDHLERLTQNAKEYDIHADKKLIRKYIGQVIKENNLKDYALRLDVIHDDFLKNPNPQTRHAVLPRRYTNMKPEISLGAYYSTRQDPHIKSMLWDTSIKAERKYAFERNDESMLLDAKTGNVTECARANIFMVENGKLITPGKGMLKGVTRKQVIAIAEDFMDISLEPINIYTLLDSNKQRELFITGTTKKIVPVTRIRTELGTVEYNIGDYTRRIIEEYNKKINDYKKLLNHSVISS